MKKLTILFLLLPVLAFAQKTQLKVIVESKAEIEIDSKKAGVADERNPLFVNVKPGKHNVKVNYESGPNFSNEVEASKGEVTDVNMVTASIFVDETIEESIKQEESKEEAPFLVTEVSATFQGGDLSKFNKWIGENIQYPVLAVKQKVEGKVYVQFIVDKEGVVEDIKILRGVDPSLDAEAVRVVNSSPKWKCAEQGGRPVRQLFTIPVYFKLPETSQTK